MQTSRQKCRIMGIINVTPDSYIAYSRFSNAAEAIEYGKRLYDEGADILDIGGQSTRPGSAIVPEYEEGMRVQPVIEGLAASVPIPLSIDTFYPGIAKKALKWGASFINDVSGLSHPDMADLAATSQATFCIMHNKGRSDEPASYPEGVVGHVLQFFENRIHSLLARGVKKEQMVLDPGIGFSKSPDENMQIIQSLASFKTFGIPLLLGSSKKSFMAKILKVDSSQLLSTTIAVNTIAIMAGIDILRVHDVCEHRKVVDLLQRFF